jgi:hypothetical protein
MNWNDKASEIAEEILGKMENGVEGSYARCDVLRGLQQAAKSGMAFECDNWVLKRQ